MRTNELVMSPASISIPITAASSGPLMSSLRVKLLFSTSITDAQGYSLATPLLQTELITNAVAVMIAEYKIGSGSPPSLNHNG